MKTTVWLTTQGLSSLHAGGIERMYLWFKEPIRCPIFTAFEREEPGYVHNYLHKKENRRIATKRAVPFYYNFVCPYNLSPDFEGTIKNFGGEIRNNDYTFYVLFSNRNWQTLLKKLMSLYIRKNHGDEFRSIPLSWIARDKKELADNFIAEEMAFPLLRKLLNDQSVASFERMYGHMKSPSITSTEHELNIILKMDIEAGVEDNDYAYPIWITKIRSYEKPLGRKNIMIWFEEPRFHEQQMLINNSSDSPFAEEPPEDKIEKPRYLDNWTNTKGRGSNHAISINSFPKEIQDIFFVEIKKYKNVSWKKMKIELPFYIKPIE